MSILGVSVPSYFYTTSSHNIFKATTTSTLNSSIFDVTDVAFIKSGFFFFFFFAFCLVALLCFSLMQGMFMYFYWGHAGARGFFYAAQLTLAALFVAAVATIVNTLKHQTILTVTFGVFSLTDSHLITVGLMLDQLALLCTATIVLLTAISLAFGIEYLAREPVAAATISTMFAFAASILWFLFSVDLGVMLAFWELAGFFSVMLINTFYSRIRTAQAVSRTFAISRVSDLCFFVATAEMLSLTNSFYLPAIFSAVSKFVKESAALGIYVVDTGALGVFGALMLIAALCKCAQFVLFVWLPDAMEAPTPASALIHSSTLVVIGIFLILKLSVLFKSFYIIDTVIAILSGVTIVYGAWNSVRTSDLKKAVAYSTISQVGYLLCGCGLQAYKEVLAYLVVHAVCKAMLFVFVGYTVHLFQGTTSMKRMGGVFFIVPHIAVSVFVLALCLSGAPLTIGFAAKELLLTQVFFFSGLVATFLKVCWFIALVLAPIYLYRIAILPYFGMPRASSNTYRKLLDSEHAVSYFAIRDFAVKKMSNPLVFFSRQWRSSPINSNGAMYLHFAMLVAILFGGEFVFTSILGMFNSDVSMSCGSFTINATSICAVSVFSGKTLIMMQSAALLVSAVVLLYYCSTAVSTRAAYLVASVILLVEFVTYAGALVASAAVILTKTAIAVSTVVNLIVFATSAASIALLPFAAFVGLCVTAYYLYNVRNIL